MRHSTRSALNALGRGVERALCLCFDGPPYRRADAPVADAADSALYHGTVTHHRTRPVAHALRYRIFLLLLDLDEAALLGRRLRWFGVDRPGLASFWQKDHGAGNAAGLRAWIDAHVTQAGLPTGGVVRVLCMPRVLGHAFNPLTVIFSHAPDGALQAVIYEVNNTFGQRHAYVLRVHGGERPVRQDCAKMFHVSPFMAMNLHYRFRVAVPGERCGIFITASDESGPVLSAAFTGRRQALTDATLVRAVIFMHFWGSRCWLAYIGKHGSFGSKV